MEQYGWNEKYLLNNGKPWIPVMGEFHYFRYEKKDWKRELSVMKAGGISIVATYVSWIYHEEIEGCFSWKGNGDLKKFILTAEECGLKVWLRIGPWIHGEVRNGGFPDWLLEKSFSARSNDSEYLKFVTSYYHQISEEINELLYKNGGPIIGIQIENEYHGIPEMSIKEQHAHIRKLHELAVKEGLIVPYYTVTGWGNAGTGRDTAEGQKTFLPVFGGYCEAPWDPRTTSIEPSPNYVFSPNRDDSDIGKDLFGTNLLDDDNEQKDDQQVPFLLSELGGGVQVTAHRRPRVSAIDIAAMSIVKLGSGANLLGYYMYHGGVNPIGEKSTMQESKETGYPNDLPIKSYDFMAPVGACGEIRDSYKEIRMLAMFLQDFGDSLAKMSSNFPEDRLENAYDTSKIRYAWRSKEEHGFLFVNCYQRGIPFSESKEQICFPVAEKEITFPEMSFKDGNYGFYPFGMVIGENTLEYASATPLCLLKGKEQVIPVFYGETKYPFFIWKNQIQPEFLYLLHEEARNAFRSAEEPEKLYFGTGIFREEEGRLIYSSEKNEDYLGVYPLTSTAPLNAERLFGEKEEIPSEQIPGEEKGCAIYLLTKQRNKAPMARIVKWVEGKSEELQCCGMLGKSGNQIIHPFSEMKTRRYQLEINYRETTGRQWLILKYRGKGARLWKENELIGDDFYNGNEWRVSLDQNGYPKKLQLEIEILYSDEQIYLEVDPFLGESQVGELDEITSGAEYEWILRKGENP